MERRDVRQIALVESELEFAFLDVEQVLVRRGENGNVRQTGFGQNQAVVKLFFGQEPLLDQPPCELFGDAVAHRFQVEGLNAPLPQLLQSFESFLLFRAAVPESEQGQFLNDGGRHRKRAALFPKNLDEIVCEILFGSEGC